MYARGPQARGQRAYISGKAFMPMLQLLLVSHAVTKLTNVSHHKTCTHTFRVNILWDQFVFPHIQAWAFTIYISF